MLVRLTIACLFSLALPLSPSPIEAAEKPKAADTPKVDTTRGDRMFIDYFRAETAKLSERSLADIKTLEDWKAKRETYRTQLFDMLGLAKLPAKTDLKPVITGTIDHDDFTVENIHFQSSPGLYVTGNLYLPKNLDKPAPTILYVCGHSLVKKGDISFGNKTGYQHHGAWFAQHGYVCLVIDSLQLGEIEGIHHGTYRYGMWWWLNRGYTPAGVEAWNCIRALDYLETRKEVDKERFGVTGRSGGGAYSWWIAAIDDRIKVAVPVAGITDLQNHVVDGCVEGHCDCMFMHNTYRWDYAQVAALVAPRPLLVSNTDKDTIFPLDGVYRIHEKVRDIYKLYGAEKSLGFHITEGPHKDTQELRIHAMVWFDRFLRKEERTIVNAAEKLFEPEQLRVFAKLPEDEKNTKIQETFVPAFASIEPPGDQAAWEKQRDTWMKALREEVFAGWPGGEEAKPLQESSMTKAFSTTEDGVELQAYDFNSQAHIRLRLYILIGADLKRLDTIEISVLDDYGWLQWRQAMQVKFGGQLKEEMRADGDERMYQALRQRLTDKNVALAFICPRGVGPTVFDQSEKKQTQNRRRFMLLGQTLDGMQVWDIRRAIQAVRVLNDEPSLILRGERGMATNVIYASLFEAPVKSIQAIHVKPTHREGPIYMNISKHFDVPQAAALAAARQPLELQMALDGDWTYLRETAKSLGWGDKRLQLTISPPPAQGPGK